MWHGFVRFAHAQRDDQRHTQTVQMVHHAESFVARVGHRPSSYRLLAATFDLVSHLNGENTWLDIPRNGSQDHSHNHQLRPAWHLQTFYWPPGDYGERVFSQLRSRFFSFLVGIFNILYVII